MPEKLLITKKELQRYDGEDLPMVIAYKGELYDVSHCPHWKHGLHEGLHFPGQDLTAELPDAPHGEEVFFRACVHKAGMLRTDETHYPEKDKGI